MPKLSVYMLVDSLLPALECASIGPLAYQDEGPCYSAKLLHPFLTILSAEDAIPGDVLRKLTILDPDRRIRAGYVHSLLRGAEQSVADLGIKAARAMAAGNRGMFDFLMTSAATPRAALGVAGRYVRLLSDGLSISLLVHGERADVRLDSPVAMPRAGEDFALITMVSNHVFGWPVDMLHAVDVWFQHGEPVSQTPYREALGATRLNFGAHWSGWSFPTRFLDVSLQRDARLHGVLRDAADKALAKLPYQGTLSERVALLISARLAAGPLTLAEIARLGGLHPRKLSRLLSAEHTTFEELLEAQRRAQALRLIASSRLAIAEVARLSGFAGRASFHRAFRRWTNETPTDYRHRHLGSSISVLSTTSFGLST